MINALPATLAARVVTSVIIVICAITIFRNSPTNAHEFLSNQGTVLMVVNLAILALTNQTVFAGFHFATFARFWWFPLLDGEWEGEVLSNFPRVEAMLLAAQRKAPAFNTLTQELPDGLEKSIPVVARIRSSLFEMSIKMEVVGTARRSETLFVRPQWRRPDAPRLLYLYKQVDEGRVAVTDTSEHFGAAILEFDKEALRLAGEYWTQRQSNKALNTAGRLVLRKRVDD